MVFSVKRSSVGDKASARSAGDMWARNTFPAPVAWIGVRRPTQFTVVIAASPITWSMLSTALSSLIAMSTVSPTSSARASQIRRLITDRSSLRVAPAAS